MAWITSTIEDDYETLENMFWPTEDELKTFKKKNGEALHWLQQHRRKILTQRQSFGLNITKEELGSAFFSSLSSQINTINNDV